MDDRTSSRRELLEAVVDADLALRPERRTFRVTQVDSRRGTRVRHPKLERERWPRQDIEDLVERKLLRLRKDKSQGWESWEFDITEAGFREVEQMREVSARASRSGPALGGLDWSAEVLPVLSAIYEAQMNAPPHETHVTREAVALQLGRVENDDKTGRVLYELTQAGYLDGLAETMGTVGRYRSLGDRSG